MERPRRRAAGAPLRALPLAAAAPLLVLLATAGAAAMYEDQAGTFDWHRQHVGEVLQAGFSPKRGRFYVATAQSMVAALGAAGGEIAWRRTYPSEDPLNAALITGRPAGAVTASGGGRYLRAWDSQGGLKWEARVPVADGTPPGAGAALAEVAPAGGAAVAILASGVVQLHSMHHGTALWSAPGPETSEEPGAVNLAAARGPTELEPGDKVMTVSFTSGTQQGSVALFNLSSGDDDALRWTLDSESNLGRTMLLTSGALFAVSEDGASVCSAALEVTPAGNLVACQLMRELLDCEGECGGGVRLVAAGGGGLRAFAAVPGFGVALLEAGDSNPELIKTYPSATAASAAFEGEGGAQLALIFGAPAATGIPVTVVDATSGEALDTWTLPPPPEAHPVHGPPAAVRAAFPATKAGGALPSKGPQPLLAVFDDHTLVHYAGGAAAWAREEALASVTATLFIDLPAAKGGDEAGGGNDGVNGGKSGGGLVPERTRRWVRMQALAVMVQFKLGAEEDAAELIRLREELSDKNLMTRDANGFRKLIVALTSAGKALALHNGDGRVVWASRFGPAARPTHLLRWRRFHDLAHAPRVALARAGAGPSAPEDPSVDEWSRAARSYVSVLDGLTGRQLERSDLDYPVEQIVPLPEPLHDGIAEQFTYLFLEPAPEPPGAGGANASCSPPLALGAHLAPPTAAAAAHLRAAAPKFVFWRAFGAGGAEGGALAGYGVDASEAGKAGGGGRVEAPLFWSVALPGRLAALAAREPSEPMHSAVKVLGNRSLKFKYTNPNTLLAVVEAAAPAAPPPAQGRRKDVGAAGAPTLTAMVINAADGAVLHQQAHRGALGPVQAVASEHWFVYSFLDTATARQQATVLELYDATPRDLSLGTVLSAVFGGDGSAAAAGAGGGGSSTPLLALSQSYFLQVRAKLLSVTQTLSGINIKQLLIGTVTDQVYAMDKRFLDPRRPMRSKATPEEAEERLAPYSDLLPFAPLSYATMDKAVAQLRAVSAQPAGLESATLVLAYGADLFYTRLTPARHFDSLGDDFAYGLLVVGLLALAAGTLFARRYSREAALQASWK
ncbi:MAG: hypothetical protein J3K34DRAFT_456487 [Monoraphidium minutum]|nr:MAG: hypothetical protein J3K34DRAFT_456487 [Monoraphidium minutum]